MHDQKHPVALIRVLSSCAALLFAKDSAAAAPVYFDLGGLVLYGLLYLLGLIALPLIIASSKEESSQRFWSWTFAAYIIVPIAYILLGVTFSKIQDERISEKIKRGETQNLEAFGKFCKDRKMVIYSKATPSNDASLAVLFDDNFNGLQADFGASAIFDLAHNKPSLCQATSLRWLEGIYDGKYSIEKKEYEKEVWRYSICSSDKWLANPEIKSPLITSKIQSRYELHLGETGFKAPVPWGNEGGRWMAKSSIRIIDRSTGQLLAEDTMYFLIRNTGESGCPRGLDQIAELITEVFPRQ